MNGLEERLRSELHAESQQITPGSLATLRLPAPRPRGRSWRSRYRMRAGHPRGWPGWAVPLTAAATVVAVIIGTVALVRTAAVSPAGPAAVSHAPAYYAYGVRAAHSPGTGSSTRTEAAVHSIDVRSVATGGLVAQVAVPRPLTSVVTLTAAANASVFVFSADRWHWQGAHHGRWRLDRHTPITFFALRITAGGHTQLSTLAQRVPVPLLQYTSIALSPDGRRLAMASVRGRTALVRVITLSSGAARDWTLPHASWQPRLEPAGAWTADGRTLVILSNGSVLPPPGIPERTPVRLLDTAAPGTSLATSRLLNLPAGSGNRARAGVFITPDGSALLEPVVHGLAPPIPSGQPGNGFLGVYSARTGGLLSMRGSWAWHGNGEPLQAVLWSSPSGDRLLALQPRPTGVTLGVLTGRSFRTTGAPLPRSPAAYQHMRAALRPSYLAAYPAGTAG